MKTILRLNLVILLASLAFSGCKKDESKITIDGGTPPVLSSVEGAEVNYANADQLALTLNWTNPEYTFNTGVSSFDVKYNVEIDTLGANFTSPNKKVISVSKDLSYTFNSSDVNDIMQNQLNLQPAMPHTLEIHVIASLPNNSEQLVSNSIQYTATPYVIPPKVDPPASGTLYIVGSAVAGGWDNPIAESNVPSQQLTQVSTTEYKITTELIGDGEYKFIGTDGSWDQQWSVQKEQPSGDPSTLSADLYFNGANCRAPQAGGTYIIDVNFQKGKITLTKQ